MRELLNYEEIADVLGVTSRTVRRMVKAREIPVIRISMRTIRFDKVKVLAALNSRKGN